MKDALRDLSNLAIGCSTVLSAESRRIGEELASGYVALVIRGSEDKSEAAEFLRRNLAHGVQTLQRIGKELGLVSDKITQPLSEA